MLSKISPNGKFLGQTNYSAEKSRPAFRKLATGALQLVGGKREDRLAENPPWRRPSFPIVRPACPSFPPRRTSGPPCICSSGPAVCARRPSSGRWCARPRWMQATSFFRSSSAKRSPRERKWPRMPGVCQWSETELAAEAAAAYAEGIPAVLLFGIPGEKDEIASASVCGGWNRAARGARA